MIELQPELPALSPAQRIALWADRIREAAVLGLRFAPTPYDHDRYQMLFDLALEMLALAAGESMADLEPLRATARASPMPFASGAGRWERIWTCKRRRRWM